MRSCESRLALAVLPCAICPDECVLQLTMVAAQVMGNHTTVSVAGSYGQFEVCLHISLAVI